jgi:hypothetical protein
MVGSLKNLYEETVASQIKIWDDEIEYLDARADILMAQIEDRYYNLIGCLRTKEKKLKQDLAALRTASEGGEEWVEIKDRLAHTTDDMTAAICRAAEEIEREREG